ncbi:MAG: hypothetical protein RLZZ468_1285 [Cyanobacteriota bacterium]
MTLPATSLELYDLLAADATLADLLGFYAFPDGPIPALAHLWKNETVRADVAGVEIVVWRLSADNPDATLDHGVALINPTFTLSAVQWQPAAPTDPYNLEAAIRRLQQLLPRLRVSDTTVPDLTVGLQQMTLSWSNPAAVVSL